MTTQSSQLAVDRVMCERAMNLTLEGGCQVPIGSYSLLDGDQIWLRGLVRGLMAVLLSVVK